MDNQEQRPYPPKPAALPTVGMPRVPAPGAAQAPQAGIPAPPPAPPPGPPAAADPAAVPPPDLAKRRRGAAILLKVAFAVVLLGVVLALVWLASRLNSQPTAPDGDPGSGVVEISPTPLASPPTLPREGVTPQDYRLGDCFKDFDPAALRSTVVACDAPHSAQLVAVFRYPGNDLYPGREALAAKALEACKTAKLAPAANNFVLNFQRAYPSGTSWDSGDRRVDCYVTADAGNVINASVIP
jgi:Septum formation